VRAGEVEIDEKKAQKDEIKTKFDKTLGTVPTCKEVARSSLAANDVWKTLKDQLEGQECFTKIGLLTLIYTSKLD
jgi:hypothetical protein